jgi:hypothetical protein
MRKTRWDRETLRETAAHMHSPYNRKTGRAADWSHRDQRRTTGRWLDSGQHFVPTFRVPGRGESA